jgi:hypothetical protein
VFTVITFNGLELNAQLRLWHIKPFFATTKQTSGGSSRKLHANFRRWWSKKLSGWLPRATRFTEGGESMYVYPMRSHHIAQGSRLLDAKLTLSLRLAA